MLRGLSLGAMLVRGLHRLAGTIPVEQCCEDRTGDMYIGLRIDPPTAPGRNYDLLYFVIVNREVGKRLSVFEPNLCLSAESSDLCLDRMRDY